MEWTLSKLFRAGVVIVAIAGLLPVAYAAEGRSGKSGADALKQNGVVKPSAKQVRKGKGPESVKGRFDLSGIWFDSPPNRREAFGAQILISHDPKSGKFSYKFKKRHDILHYIGEASGTVSGNRIRGKMRWIHPNCPSIQVPWRADVLKASMGDGTHVLRIAWDIPSVRPTGPGICDFGPQKGWSGNAHSWFRPSPCKYVTKFKKREDVPDLLEKLRRDLDLFSKVSCD